MKIPKRTPEQMQMSTHLNRTLMLCSVGFVIAMFMEPTWLGVSFMAYFIWCVLIGFYQYGKQFE